jgi:parallel beta-helix repeat protein
MNRRTIGILALLIITFFALCSGLRIEKAGAVIEYVYIRADGSIDPLIAPITTTDNITYTLTNDLYSQIVVEKNSIIVNGSDHMLARDGTGIGLNLTSRANVTIQNLQILNFQSGIRLIQSNNIRIFNTEVSNNTFGIWVYGTHNTLAGNTIKNNTNAGIVIDVYSFNNSIYGNNITDNSRGMWTIMAYNNLIHHNNFVNNTVQAYAQVSGYQNNWTAIQEGNYWSDYSGSDPDYDGVGNSPVTIDANNNDSNPLINPVLLFQAGVWDGETYHIAISSNSTISDFSFDPSPDSRLIKLNVTGEDESQGICRVMFKHKLLWVDDGWTIRIGGAPPVYASLTDGIYNSIHFSYQHSTKTVEIQGTHVIPEFPQAITVLLFVIATTLATLHLRRRPIKRALFHLFS